MYKVTLQINNIGISDFSISSDNKFLMINQQDSCALLNRNFEKINLNEYKKYFGIIYNNLFWFADYEKNRTLIINENLLEIANFDFIGGIPNPNSNYIYNNFLFVTAYYNGDYSKSDLVILNNENQIISIKNNDLLGLNGVDIVINEDKFISKNNNEIGLFTFKNEKLWQISYSELVQSEQAFLGSDILKMDGKLFFLINGTHKGGLFCLDIETGKILKQFSNMAYFLVKDENYIYTVKFRDILCKINPFTLEIEEWNVHELIRNAGFDSIQDHRCTAQNGLIYFTQTLGDNKAIFGVLDFNNEELVYRYDFEPQNGGIGSIQVNDNRVFIHTQDNTLHIFEKE